MSASRRPSDREIAIDVVISDPRSADAELRARLPAIARAVNERLLGTALEHLGPLEVEHDFRHQQYIGGLRSRATAQCGNASIVLGMSRHRFDEATLVTSAIKQLKMFRETGAERSSAMIALRRDVEATMARFRTDDVPLDRWSVGWVSYGGMPNLSVEFEGYQANLRSGPIPIRHTHPTTLLRHLAEELDKQDALAALRRSLQSMNASILIDGAALRLSQVLGLNTRDLTEDLAAYENLAFQFLSTNGRRYSGSFFWAEGALAVEFATANDDEVRLTGDLLTLGTVTLSEIGLFGLVGQPLAALVEIPWLPDAVVAEASSEHGRTDIVLDLRRFALTPDGPVALAPTYR